MVDIVNSGLDQHGLRQSREPAAADLKVAASLRFEKRLRQYNDSSGAYYGNGPYRDQYGAWATVPLVRTYEQEVAVVTWSSTTPATTSRWSGSAESDASGSRSDRTTALREAIREALENYPPR